MTGKRCRAAPCFAVIRLAGLLLAGAALLAAPGCGAETSGGGASPLVFAEVNPQDQAGMVSAMYDALDRERESRRADLVAELTRNRIGTTIDGPSQDRFEGIVTGYLSGYYADMALQTALWWDQFPELTRPAVVDLFLTLGRTDRDYLSGLTASWLRSYGDGNIARSTDRLHAATDGAVNDALLFLGF